MRRTVGPLILAVCLAGCNSLWGQAVYLRTGDPDAPEWGPDRGCNFIWTEGTLGWNETDGTTIAISTTAFGPVDAPEPIALTWPPGYTARRSSDAIVVLTPGGNVVATTGRTFRFSGLFEEPRSTVCYVLQ